MSVDPTQLPQNAPGNDTTDKPIAPDEVSGGRSVEEVEAYWRNRVSRKDSAHSAAERALREQIEQLQARRDAVSTAAHSDGQSAGSPAEAELRRQIEETRLQLKQEQEARAIDARKAKYPLLAAQGVEDAVFATASEASLAKLNELANDEPRGTFIAPTGPKRGAPTPPPKLSEMTKDQLLDQLRDATRGMTTA